MHKRSSSMLDIKKDPVSAAGCYFPKRFIFVILGFCGMLINYGLRINLSVALVAMVNETSKANLNRYGNSSLVEECSASDYTGSSSSQAQLKGERYDWDAKTQGQIMSSFFYTYFITLLFGGYIAERFGAARMLGLGLLMTSVLTLLTPMTVRWGLTPFLILRALEGIGEGNCFPAMQSLISHWSPVLERSRIHSVVMSGLSLGSVLVMSGSGWLCTTDFLGGWPSVFYVSGTVGLLWYALWFIFIYETPQIHPTISKAELRLFETKEATESKQVFKVPWKEIFKSTPFWALLITHFGVYFAENVFLLELPTYLRTVLHLDMKAIGALSALPYILKLVGCFLSSYAADRTRSTGRLSITTIRKIFNSISGYSLAICILGVTQSGCNATLIMFLFSLGMFLNSFKYSGFCVTYIDMSPDFAGTLFGITDSLASLTGIMAPSMTGAFLQSGPTISNWSKVFYVTAAIQVITTTVYALFASADLQPWGKLGSVPNSIQKPTESAKEKSPMKKTEEIYAAD